MTTPKDQCIFCNKTNCQVIKTTKYFFIIRDTAYPVTKHHTLIVVNRHLSDYFDLKKKLPKNIVPAFDSLSFNF